MTYKDNVKCALDVIAGKYGNHEARRQALTQAGFDYDTVQGIVNDIVYGKLYPEDVLTDGTTEDIPESDILNVDYDPEKYRAICINIIV